MWKGEAFCTSPLWWSLRKNSTENSFSFQQTYCSPPKVQHQQPCQNQQKASWWLALKASPSETCFCPNFWFQAGVKPCHLVEIWVNTIKVNGNTHLYFENWSSIHKVHLVCLHLCVQNSPLKLNFSYGENPSFFFLKLEWWKVLYCTTESSWK